MEVNRGSAAVRDRAMAAGDDSSDADPAASVNGRLKAMGNSSDVDIVSDDSLQVRPGDILFGWADLGDCR